MLVGDRPFVRALASEISVHPDNVPEAIDLEVHVGPFDEVARHYRPLIYSAKEHVSFSATAIGADEPVRYVVDGLFDPSRRCQVMLDDRTEPLIAKWRRRLGRTIAAHPAASYALLWFVVHVRLVLHGATSLHGGVADLAGRAIAFAGTGGAGKTSLLFAFMRLAGARYLAEDFAIVDGSGIVHFSPKSVSIYATDRHVGDVALDAYLRRLAPADRFKWSLHRRVFKTIPMVKAPVAELLSAERVGSSAPLATCIYLIRTSRPSPRIHDASPVDIANRLTEVAAREHKRLLELLHLVAANQIDHSPAPPAETLLALTRDRLQAALAKADCHVVEVPALATPGQVIELLAAARLLPQ
jgi:hypothetical protein